MPSYYGSHANKTTKGLRSGSILFGKDPTCQPTTNVSEFIAKQVLCRPDSYSKQEPNVRTLWPDVKTMVSHTKLTAPSAAPKQLSRCVNPNQLKTRRSESNLRLCGGCWPNSSKISSLMEMTKVHLSSQRSTHAHKSSALKIEGTDLENQCSNLPPLEVDSCLPLLHLTCVFLVFPVKCCDGSSLKPARPMCDGRPFASPLFRRLASRGALFRGLLRWVLHFVLSWTRSVIVHDATLSSREDPLFECGRPRDALSCLFFSAGDSASEGSRPDLFQDVPDQGHHMLTSRAHVLDWPVNPFARFDESRPSSSPEDPIDEQQLGALPASTRSRCWQDALQPPQVLQGIAGWMHVAIFLDGGLRCITWNTRGLVGSGFFQAEEQRTQTQISQEAL